MKRYFHSLVAATVITTVVVVTAIAYLGGPDFLVSRPIVFEGDGTYFYAYAKAILRDGWTWHTDLLGAPFGFRIAAYPSNLTIETGVMKAIALTTDDPIALLNRCWLLGLVATGLCCYAALRLLQLKPRSSAVAACLFAVIPYAFFRNVGHFNLLFYAIPLPAAGVLLLLTGELGTVGRWRFVGLAGGCAALGLSYVYNAFFTSFLLSAGLAIAALSQVGGSSLRRGAICLALVLVTTAANLLPSIIEWRTNGRPDNLDFKNIPEADTLALRLRDVLLPDQHSPIPGFSSIGRASINVMWPNQNESQTAKIGSVAAVGFFLVILVLVGINPDPGSPDNKRRAAAAWSILLLLLLSVPGGLGSIFNLFVSPDIRAYNRIVPFLAFFCLFEGASWFEIASQRWRLSLVGVCIALSVILLFGLFDQDVSRHLRATAARNRQEAESLSSFIRELETMTAKDAPVFMFPVTTFPPDLPRNRMQPYDHGKPALFSHSLRWSWPPFGIINRAWAKSLSNMQGYPAVTDLVQSGFRYAWVDRFGFSDEGAGVCNYLKASGAKELLESPNKRYSVFVLADADLKDRDSSLMTPVTVEFQRGFYAEERTAEGTPFRWVQHDATIILRNMGASPRKVSLEFAIQSFIPASTVHLASAGISLDLPMSNPGERHRVEVLLPPQVAIPVRFSTSIPRPKIRDWRNLRFALHNFEVHDLP